MKPQILIALGAAAVLSATANAQTVPNDGDGVQLRKNPYLGEIFPNLDANRPAGTRLKTVNNYFIVEIVQQDSGQALRQLAKVLGVRVVIDPEIKFLPAKTRSLIFNAVKDDAFDDVSDKLIGGEAIEKWKSPSGVYFFAAKPASPQSSTNYFQMPDGTWQRFDLLPPGNLRVTPSPFNGAPFLSEPPEQQPHIDPDFVWNFERYQPLPNAEKRRFKPPFYRMPLPTPGLPSEPLDSPYVLPIPPLGPVKR